MTGAIDFAALITNALTSPAFVDAITQSLAPQVADLVAHRIETAQRDQLQPLGAILGISARAARGRLDRDAELRALGLRCGRSLVFRRAEVEALFSERQREQRHLRAVGGTR